MDQSLEYLLDYLQEEFRGSRHVRVRLVQSSGVRKSPDLEQNYDSESNTLHRARGVMIVTTRREYYFPAEWIENREFSRLHELVGQIRESLT
jgi:hypothetical protein